MIKVKADTVEGDIRCCNEMYGSGEQLMMEWAIARKALVREIANLIGAETKEIDMVLRAYEKTCPEGDNSKSIGMVY